MLVNTGQIAWRLEAISIRLDAILRANTSHFEGRIESIP